MPRPSPLKKIRVKPTTKEGLHRIIKKEMKRNGPACDLNFIDVSEIEDFSELFINSDFNGDISKWNVSRATSMASMFEKCKFNGDLSKWDVSSVVDMVDMFSLGHFNGDLSKWNVGSVRWFKRMFYGGAFESDISAWAIHPDAEIFTMYSLEQTKTAQSATLLHWRLADLNSTFISPVLRAFYEKNALVTHSIMPDSVERSYWLQAQWRKEQADAQLDAIQDRYAVDSNLFESQSSPSP